jgi:hypothetical protein
MLGLKRPEKVRKIESEKWGPPALKSQRRAVDFWIPVDRSGGRHFSDPIFLINAWPEKARKGQKDRVRKMGATGTEIAA